MRASSARPHPAPRRPGCSRTSTSRPPQDGPSRASSQAAAADARYHNPRRPAPGHAESPAAAAREPRRSAPSRALTDAITSRRPRHRGRPRPGRAAVERAAPHLDEATLAELTRACRNFHTQRWQPSPATPRPEPLAHRPVLATGTRSSPPRRP
ncbi:hypothetical protein ACU686_11850, partial [Yinghuangia aomiensis]